MTSMPLQEDLDRRWAAGPEGIPALVDWLLSESAWRGASDLHLEPRADAVLLRWRLDGCLIDAGLARGPLRANLVQRVKVMAGLLTYRTDIPQDGRINAASIPGMTDLRVSVYPAVQGEKVVIRFFSAGSKGGEADSAAEPLAIESLGLDPADLARMRQFLARPQGMLLLTGPAGSGKTSTLYASLGEIVEASAGRRQIVTIEDPVERILPGVTHTELKPAAGIDYPAALKAILRQDPEVIMIGEIRDAETAQVAVQAALTGHLLLSTVHAPSAPEVLLRLMHLGLEPYLVASVVGGVLDQRLIRRLCEHCRRPAGANGHFEAGGCDSCAGTGYRGRLLVAEWLAVEGALRSAVVERKDGTALLAAAAGAGWRGLWARGLEKMAQGLTGEAELRRVLVPA